ncbi:antitoxin [Streptomyces sp. SID3212]|uniref:antitoxin n=1 Tax=Streptomyces sp. SID3212 TaxID=2690259 RepID=UPI00136F2868|nr:antitoxin [Streptomyces sp. SID3212]MYV55968.1 antitoxin [Streptomyces sp. SID3212]
MSMMDKLKNLMKGHDDASRQGVDKGGDAFDAKTDNKYSGQTDSAQKRMNEQMGTQEPPSDDRPPQP